MKKDQEKLKQKVEGKSYELGLGIFAEERNQKLFKRIW